ncbi:MAG TPA: winged helix-turn-helix domain-containing protein [Gaiellaceae bacterium]
MKSSSVDSPRLSLVTNHGQVLACIAADPNVRLRDIADNVGITERTAAQIVGELEHAGYLTKTRVGRRNRYRIDAERKVRTASLASMTVAQAIAVLLEALDQQPFS